MNIFSCIVVLLALDLGGLLVESVLYSSNHQLRYSILLQDDYPWQRTRIKWKKDVNAFVSSPMGSTFSRNYKFDKRKHAESDTTKVSSTTHRMETHYKINKIYVRNDDHARKNNNLIKLFASTTGSSSSTSSSSDIPSSSLQDNPRLAKAKLRLAEARGILPAGYADRVGGEVGGFLGGISSGPALERQTKVRDLTFKVAEPEVRYDPIRIEMELWRQPFRWLKRNIELFVPFTGFVSKVILDIQTNKEEENRRLRAQELQDLIAGLGPAIIKAGQALSSRPDLLPNEYLEELQKLQDRVPPFDNNLAFAEVEAELGIKFDDVFELVERNPIAAASIGQVYKARLRATGEEVALKVQRPKCEDIICVDLYVMRFYATLINKIFKFLRRDIDVASIIDDFGELIYREIDYKAEAANAQRFAELYGGLEEVYVPRIYTELSTSKVLTMEWVNGVRLVDKDKITEMYRDMTNVDSSSLVYTMVQCSLRQMLENGFFHADPHAGNLLAMPDGKLCYLDFGMMSYVESSQRYSIIEAVVHLVNRDFEALAQLYKRMGFIPQNVDTKPIIEALSNALPDVLNASVGELNFKNVINKLGDVMYKFPFSLPPYYIAIIRCLGVLEGLAIQVDKGFRIISDAYPYIASRLLNDSSPELQSALKQLILKEGKPNWDRLEQLLEVASSSSDYDVILAIDQLLDYALSDQGDEFLQIFANELVEAIDSLSTEAAVSTIDRIQGGLGNLLPAFPGRSGDIKKTIQDDNTIKESKKESTTLVTARKLASTLTQSSDIDAERVLALVRRIAREPKAQDLGLDIVENLSERLISKSIKLLFQLPLEENQSSRSNRKNGI